MQQTEETKWDIEEALLTQRERLVRLCAYLTGSEDAAEDLAQETAIEAWRHAHNLRDPQAIDAWLSGIARNVCLRWHRRQGRERKHIVRDDSDETLAETSSLYEVADEFDLEIELERSELVELLDRALGLLSPETRSVMVQKFVGDSPHSEIAARLRMSEGAVAMRVQRGKLALRRILGNQLREEALSYGLAQDEDWRETRIWCPTCGRHKLLGRFNGSDFGLRCPVCSDSPHPFSVMYHDQHGLLNGVRGYKRAMTRLLEWSHDYFTQGIQQRSVNCMKCGRPAPLHLKMTNPFAERYHLQGVNVMCDACRVPLNRSLHALALSMPEGRRFWREHARVHALPLREIIFQNCDAYEIGFESVSRSARFETHVLRETFQVIGVHLPPA
jgi:RNA polymerase sigma-70 factor (ECF subfamily)